MFLCYNSFLEPCVISSVVEVVRIPYVLNVNIQTIVTLVLLLWAGELSQYSVLLRAGRPGNRSSIPGRGEMISPLTFVSRPSLGPTQPPVQWVPLVLSPRLKRGRSVKLTTRLHLVPRSWMSRSYTSSHPKRLRGVWWDSFSFLVLFFIHTYSKFPWDLSAAGAWPWPLTSI
jgi:hypothetical protein